MFEKKKHLIINLDFIEKSTSFQSNHLYCHFIPNRIYKMMLFIIIMLYYNYLTLPHLT